MDRCRAAAPAFRSPSLHRPGKPGCCMDADDGPEPGDDEELGVFAAERYFYGGDDGDVPWCTLSSSSLFSSAFRAATLDADRSVPTPTATSSSEASWNSRSALLLASERPEKSHAAAAATPIAEAGTAAAESERGRRKPAAASSNLRRWLLGVAGCACAGGGGDGEESVSADDGTEAGDDVLGVGGKKCSTEAAVAEMLPRMEANEETAGDEAASARVRLGSGRLGDGGAFPGGREAFNPVQLAGNSDEHRRAAAYSGELSTPILHPAAAATADERRRRSFEMPHLPVGDHGSALTSAAQNSVVTIVAGSTVQRLQPRARHAIAAGAGSPGEDDDAAPSELGCGYQPSEASVVWSVVTADGAASGNFSSAASGYYCHYLHNGGGEAGASRKSSRGRRRSGVTGSGGLLTCMSQKAADAVGPAPSVHRPEVKVAAVARLGAAGGRRDGPGRSRRT